MSNVNDVKTGLIKTRRIVFTPNTSLKQELKDTAIQITCYDRNGDIVRRVTSTSGDVVTEPDVDSTDDNKNSGSSQNGSSDNGSSGNTGTGTVTPSTGEGGDEG